MFSKPTFGQNTTPSFGGFNATPTTTQTGSTPFGQNAFNKPATGATGFAAPSFGSGSTMFGGGAATPNTGLFGSTAPPAFGQQAQQATPGFSGFSAGTNAPLFGPSAGVSGFAQPKPTFGGFGASTSSSGLFGTQPTVTGTAAGQPTPSLFNQNSNLFGAGFGGQSTSGGATLGTPIKFNALTGTDAMTKNNVTQTINTRHQCITCMKEYENKSLEELRLEDLQAGRKGPSGDGMFGSQPQPAQNSLFGASTLAQPGTSAPSFAGFGNNNTTFGATSTAGGSMFGKPPGFGAATTTTTGFSFNSNTTAANPFGAAANQNKPFGAPATGSMFGAQTTPGGVFGAQPTTGFGAGFGTQQQQQQQSIGLFGQNKAAPFGMAAQQPTTTSSFSFGQNTATQGTGMFGAKPQLGTTMGSFGTTPSLFGAKSVTTPAFGNAPFGATTSTALGGTTSNLFGQSTFGKPGTTTTTGFGFGQPQTGTVAPNQGLAGGNMFGSTLGKPATSGGLFGSSGGGLFGGGTTGTTGTSFGLGSAFGGQTLGQNSGLNFNANKPSMFPTFGGTSLQQNATSAPDPHQRMSALLANPFERPIFNGLPTDKLKELMNSTNPGVLKAVQSQATSAYSLSPTNSKPMLAVSPKTMHPKKSLFEGLESSSPSFLGGATGYTTPSFQHKTLTRRRAAETTAADASPTVTTTTTATVTTPPETLSSPPPTMITSLPQNSSQWLNNSVSTPEQQPNKPQSPPDPSVEVAARRLALDELQSFNDSNISASPTELSEPLELEDEAPPPHPAGIVLQRPGYFTIPTLKELEALTDENGRCEVSSFTVGRENYGNVYFNEPLDVANLNLDRLVHIRHREITVYPDDADKPPEGQGLNRKAVVTLDRVFPSNKKTRQPITNPEAIREMDFEAVLRRKCAKMEARFVEYRMDTGSFVFKVDHFSKYEVNDDSEGEEELVKKPKVAPKPPQAQQKPTQPPSAAATSALALQSFEAEPMDQGVPPLDTMTQKADPSKVRVMKVSFFDNMDSRSELEVNVEQSFSYLDTPPPSVGPTLPRTDSEEVARERPVRPRHQPPLVTPKYHMMPARVALNATLSIADAALFMSRSFRTSWAPNSTLLFPQSLSVKQVRAYKTTYAFKDWVDRHLKVQLQHTGITSDGGQVPRRCVQPGLAALEAHCQLLTAVQDQTPQQLLIRQTLQLCLVLWGQCGAEDARAPVVAFLRKEALREWLREVIESADGGEQSVLNFLNKGQLLDAVRTSQDIGEHYSALVLATAGSRRLFVQQQLQEWVSDEVSEFVDAAKLRTWLLAGAGQPQLPLETGEVINVFQGLDWLSCLAVHFWYLCSHGASIPDVLAQYEHAFTSHFAAAPVPPGGTEDDYDIRFHLLKLFSQRTYAMEPLLKVETHFPLTPLDMSLSWLTLVLLDALHYTHVDDYCARSIHLAFAEQLEAADLWHWAVFVLQHVTHAAMRDQAVEQTLSRHVTLDDDLSPREDFVVSQLDVPASLVFRLKSYHATSQKMYCKAARFQIQAHEWAACHRTVIDHLVNDAIINGDTDLVARLLHSLRHHAEQIESWDEQGCIFLDYLTLVEDVKALQTLGRQDEGFGFASDSNLESLHQRLKSLSGRFANLPDNSHKDRLCQAEMSQYILTLLRTLALDADYQTILQSLRLPDDQLLREQDLAHTLV